MRVTGLRIYPVKSMAGNFVENAEVLPWGLAEEPNARSNGAHHGGLPGDPLSLADTAPLLLVTESSMALTSFWTL